MKLPHSLGNLVAGFLCSYFSRGVNFLPNVITLIAGCKAVVTTGTLKLDRLSFSLFTFCNAEMVDEWEQTEA
jgi:hypothetical protein